jgi:hypothetical protein
VTGTVGLLGTSTNLQYDPCIPITLLSHAGERKFQLQKEVMRPKLPCRTSKSSTWLHHQVHSFMAHGVDPLVEIGGQQSPFLDIIILLSVMPTGVARWG